MKLTDLIRRAEDLRTTGEAVLKTTYDERYNFVDEIHFRAFRSASLSCLLAACGETHPYYKEFASQVDVARQSPT